MPAILELMNRMVTRRRPAPREVRRVSGGRAGQGSARGDAFMPGCGAYEVMMDVPLDVQRRGELAIVRIGGSIGRDFWDYDIPDSLLVDRLKEVTQLALTGEVTKCLLAFDCPGGNVASLGAVDAALEDLAGACDVYACGEYEMCSFAYWMAMHATEVTATATAMVGSIGAMFQAVDSSENWRQAGLRRLVATDAPAKALGMDGVPHGEAQQAELDALAGAIGARFRARVSEKRGLTERQLLDMGGTAAHGPEALALGLIDRVVVFDRYVDELAGEAKKGSATVDVARTGGAKPATKPAAKTTTTTAAAARAGAERTQAPKPKPPQGVGSGTATRNANMTLEELIAMNPDQEEALRQAFAAGQATGAPPPTDQGGGGGGGAESNTDDEDGSMQNGSGSEDDKDKAGGGGGGAASRPDAGGVVLATLAELDEFGLGDKWAMGCLRKGVTQAQAGRLAIAETNKRSGEAQRNKGLEDQAKAEGGGATPAGAGAGGGGSASGGADTAGYMERVRTLAHKDGISLGEAASKLRKTDPEAATAFDESNGKVIREKVAEMRGRVLRKTG